MLLGSCYKETVGNTKKEVYLRVKLQITKIAFCDHLRVKIAAPSPHMCFLFPFPALLLINTCVCLLELVDYVLPESLYWTADFMKAGIGLGN